MFNVDIAAYHKQCTKRSMAEAFSDVRAPAIEVYRPVSHTLRSVLLSVAIGIGIAATLVAWWSS